MTASTVPLRAALYLRVSTARQSKENARHVLRALKEIARQGFRNGSPPAREQLSEAAVTG